MKKTIIALALAFALIAPAGGAHALSCVTLDMYLDHVLTDDTDGTFMFVGTATPVTKNHTQVVMVTKPLKGWVAPEMWIKHNWSQDWKYFCSNGPAKAGESTLFFVSIDPYGSFQGVQTLKADSAEAKAFIAKVEKKVPDTDRGITVATPADRATEVMDQIRILFEVILNMIQELNYWQSKAK